MDNDDLPVGRILTRREALALLGTASAAAMIAACAPNQAATAQPTAAGAATALNAGAQTAAAVASNPTAAATVQSAVSTAVAANATALPTCVVRPELTVGPYFVDEQLNRSDIRSEPSDNSVKEGVPLNLTFNVSQIANSACTPLEGAQVDVWHCDAQGQYSGVTDQGFNTVGEKWLRGYQLTDANGIANFTTIYPGWYQGRTVHIHFKVRTTGTNNDVYDFTSQLFFDDSLSDEVFTQPAYSGKGQRGTLNSNDGIFSDQLLLAPSGDNSGYNAAFALGLDLSDTSVGATDTMGGPGGGGPPGGPRGTATP